ncbi:MAG: substrate-binding domain-containing protein [Gallionella sp.]
MFISRIALSVLVIVVGLLANPAYAENVSGKASAASAFVAVPPNKDNDLRIFYADGKIATGSTALGKINSDANLVMWLAGNQFFAMEDVIHAFQKAHPEIGNVAVITLPPGILLNAIVAGGWSYEGKDYAMEPDIYASVNMGHLDTLKAKGKMDKYMIYTHNALELMVAKGNPKNIKGIDDLGRNDLRIMLPNPVTEGIMTFYAKKVLQNHKLWDKLSGGKECKSCDPTPNVHFTAVHHREIPDGLTVGTVDVGINWATEVKNSLAAGRPIEGVELPPEDSLINEVSYAIGTLNTARHQKAANKYLAFLQSASGQDEYAKFGFIKASKENLEIRPIP